MICPNCGQHSDYPRVCPNCGHVVSSPGNRGAAVVIFVFLVLPCAGIGTCMAYALAPSSPQDRQFFYFVFGGPIVIGLVGLLFWVRKLWRG